MSHCCPCTTTPGSYVPPAARTRRAGVCAAATRSLHGLMDTRFVRCRHRRRSENYCCIIYFAYTRGTPRPMGCAREMLLKDRTNRKQFPLPCAFIPIHVRVCVYEKKCEWNQSLGPNVEYFIIITIMY